MPKTFRQFCEDFELDDWSDSKSVEEASKREKMIERREKRRGKHERRDDRSGD
jgi:hypothetical protein